MGWQDSGGDSPGMGCGGLENCCGGQPHRGFESHALRPLKSKNTGQARFSAITEAEPDLRSCLVVYGRHRLFTGICVVYVLAFPPASPEIRPPLARPRYAPGRPVDSSTDRPAGRESTDRDGDLRVGVLFAGTLEGAVL